MRLIDADKLRKAIPAEEDNITGMGMTYDEMEAYNDGIDEQWEEIVNAPTIDAVEVVRCKDCKHFEYDHVENVDGIPLIVAHEICTRWSDGVKTSENGYCFLGERGEADET